MTTAPLTGWRCTIGAGAVATVDHLLDGTPLCIPGYPNPGDAHDFIPDTPTQLYPHPTQRTQLPVIAGHLHTLTATGDYLVSLAHLAHRNCPACAQTWDTTTEWLTTTDTLFTHCPLTPGAGTLLLHYEDAAL